MDFRRGAGWHDAAAGALRSREPGRAADRRARPRAKRSSAARTCRGPPQLALSHPSTPEECIMIPYGLSETSQRRSGRSLRPVRASRVLAPGGLRRWSTVLGLTGYTASPASSRAAMSSAARLHDAREVVRLRGDVPDPTQEARQLGQAGGAVLQPQGRHPSARRVDHDGVVVPIRPADTRVPHRPCSLLGTIPGGRGLMPVLEARPSMVGCALGIRDGERQS